MLGFGAFEHNRKLAAVRFGVDSGAAYVNSDNSCVHAGRYAFEPPDVLTAPGAEDWSPIRACRTHRNGDPRMRTISLSSACGVLCELTGVVRGLVCGAVYYPAIKRLNSGLPAAPARSGGFRQFRRSTSAAAD
ncbi:hypothetical protein HPP92_028909 [Vanilla planifolia]|uniref:Uncharacterized protein n=1 Tax=Vanilla planifolia TaxID=51239 RepID=A0A835P6S3_VANPL|nr:hypothetical protein HPP92_028909 [Vanilla planifolia]KAG0446312.1 hypothetical protein HPP92_028899 [Vanilla planifolia]